MELQQDLVVPLQVHRSVSMTATSLVTRARVEAGQRLLHVVQHAEVEHDVEHADLGEVDRVEVGHQRLDLRAQGRPGQVESRRPGRSGYQKSVSSRDWSGRTPASMHSAQ